MRDVFIRELTAIAAERPDVMLITADLGFGVLEEFATRFPKQFLNVGVAEQNMTAVATGLALEGAIVFTYSLGNFPTLRCLEQIRNDACYHNVNVKIVTVGGGMSYGAVGASHHATEDLAIMRALPGTTVVSPCDNWEAAEATRAIVDRQGVAYLRLDKSIAPPSHRFDELFHLGRARTIVDGSAATLIATGGILGEAMKAAETLRARGFALRVLSVHSIKPLDRDAIVAAANQTGGIVTIEEHAIDGGLGGAVAEALLDAAAAPGFFARIGLRSCFSSAVGSQQYLRSVYGMDAEAIAEVVSERVRAGRRLPEVA
ncbi:MAG: transketolase C-terminal domain-containing protein [Bryobacteraceae bacterium]|jgi:transketolase